MDVGPSEFNTGQGIEYYKEDSKIQINCPELLGQIVTLLCVYLLSFVAHGPFFAH